MKKKNISDKSNFYVQVFFHIVFIAVFAAVAIFGVLLIGGKDLKNFVRKTGELITVNKPQTSPAKKAVVTYNTAVPKNEGNTQGKSSQARPYILKPDEIAVKAFADNAPGYKNYTFKLVHNIKIRGNLKKMTVDLAIPYNETGKQYVDTVIFSHTPVRFFKAQDNTFAEFVFYNVSSNISLSIEGRAKIRTYDLQRAKAENRNISGGINREMYLKPQKYIESNDPDIIAAANSITGRNREEIVKNIYSYVNSRIRYHLSSETQGAKKTLLLGSGKCEDFSALMVALCRAKGIPARVVAGHYINNVKNEAHCWVEVWFENYGFVSFDPTKNPTVFNIRYPDGSVKTNKVMEYDFARVDCLSLLRNDFAFWKIMTLKLPDSNADLDVWEYNDIRRE